MSVLLSTTLALVPVDTAKTAVTEGVGEVGSALQTPSNP